MVNSQKRPGIMTIYTGKYPVPKVLICNKS